MVQKNNVQVRSSVSTWLWVGKGPRDLWPPLPCLPSGKDDTRSPSKGVAFLSALCPEHATPSDPGLGPLLPAPESSEFGPVVRHPQGQGNMPLSLLDHSSGTRTLESPPLTVQNLLPGPARLTYDVPWRRLGVLIIQERAGAGSRLSCFGTWRV